MTQLSSTLNLARLWRPQTFDAVVGQELSVRMLKNSLYLNKIFPVYLFTGQRGCGKTSMARIFSASINCQKIADFQKNPTQIAIPCLTCQSCLCMQNATHPDFIEIDAASHTGVDNIRQIIETSNYMPGIGVKKIYLIDEVHMLSKAAFNALLKVLEEPPMSVIFILATTEIQKIPDTVLSRCFQVLFNPISSDKLKKLIQTICVAENITITPSAIDIIIAQTEGCARDSINMLERVRFSGSDITEDVLLQTLGLTSSQDLCTIFMYIINNNVIGLLSFLSTINFEQRSASAFWDNLMHYCRYIIWIKHDVAELPANLLPIIPLLKQLAVACSLARITSIYNFFWQEEPLFLKTEKKHAFIEMILVQLCEQGGINNEIAPSSVTKKEFIHDAAIQIENIPSVVTTNPAYAQIKQVVSENKPLIASSIPSNPTHQLQEIWEMFIQAIAATNDQVLLSIFKQAILLEIDKVNKTIIIQLNTDSNFLKNSISLGRSLWLPILEKIIPDCHSISYGVQVSKVSLESIDIPIPQNSIHASTMNRQSEIHSTSTIEQKKSHPIPFLLEKDLSVFPFARLILKHFPGRMKRVKINN